MQQPSTSTAGARPVRLRDVDTRRAPGHQLTAKARKAQYDRERHALRKAGLLPPPKRYQRGLTPEQRKARQREYRRRYNQKNREKVNEYQRQKYAERRAGYVRKYNASEKGRAAAERYRNSEQGKRWYAEYVSRPEVRERMRQYRKKNEHKWRANANRKRRDDPKLAELNRQRVREWRRKNKARKDAYNRKWWAEAKADPAKWKATRERISRWARARWAERRLRANAGDPEALAWVARDQQRRRDWYRKVTSDPAMYAAYRARVKKYLERQRTRKHARDPRKAASVLAELGRMVPRSMPLEIRGDLINDLYAALLAGEITREHLPHVLKKYTARAWKLLGETWNQRSLDDVIPGTDGLTYAETIADNHPHF